MGYTTATVKIAADYESLSVLIRLVPICQLEMPNAQLIGRRLRVDDLALPVLTGGIRHRALSRNRDRSRDVGQVNRAMAQLSYRRHRFPAEIIQHAIWLYLRFTLSYREVEELLAVGSTSRMKRCGAGCLKFGPPIARKLRQSRPPQTDDGTSTVCHEHASEGGGVVLYER